MDNAPHALSERDLRVLEYLMQHHRPVTLHRASEEVHEGYSTTTVLVVLDMAARGMVELFENADAEKMVRVTEAGLSTYERSTAAHLPASD